MLKIKVEKINLFTLLRRWQNLIPELWSDIIERVFPISVTVLNLGKETSDCLRPYLEMCGLNKPRTGLGDSVYLTL